MMSNLIIFTLRQMLLRCYDKGHWDWLDIQHAGADEKCVLKFSRETWKEEANRDGVGVNFKHNITACPG